MSRISYWRIDVLDLPEESLFIGLVGTANPSKEKGPVGDASVTGFYGFTTSAKPDAAKKVR
jgi:hypothetical protein